MCLTDLRAEQGGRIESALARIESALEDPDIFEDLVAQENFELKRAVPLSQLHFHEM